MVYKEFSPEKVIVVNEPKRDNGWATKAHTTGHLAATGKFPLPVKQLQVCFEHNVQLAGQ